MVVQSYRYQCLPEPKLHEGPLSVESVQPRHIETIRLWRNAQMDVLRQDAIIMPEQQISYFSTHIWPDMGVSRPKNILFIYLDGDKPIGYGGLTHIAWENRRAEVSFLLDPVLARVNDLYANLFSTFLALMRVLAFRDLGLDRIFTETYAVREHHISVLEACGFLREGVLKNHVRINKRPVDSVFHGITRSREGQAI